MAAADILPLDVYVGQDFYAPAFRLMIGGVDARVLNNDVMNVTFQDSLTEIDSFEMTVMNWDAEKRTFKYSDGNLLDPWQEVEFWLGYYRNGQQEVRRMLTGEITTLSPDFPASGAPTLTVRALNLLHRFRLKQEVRTFLQKKDTEIAKILVEDISAQLNQSGDKNARKAAPKQGVHRLEIVIDPEDVENNLKKEKPIQYLVVNNQYPILFLMERARRIGYELTLEEVPQGSSRKVTLHYGPTNLVNRPTYVLEWGKSLISFRPTLQMANQVSSVTVRGWDPKGKKKFEATATRADLAAEGVVNPGELGVNDEAVGQKLEIAVDKPIESQEEAKNLAKKRFLQIAEIMVEAKGKTIGLPDLRAGVKVQIKGLGTRFSGPAKGPPFSYLITSTTHTIGDGGYSTDFTARMEKSS